MRLIRTSPSEFLDLLRRASVLAHSTRPRCSLGLRGLHHTVQPLRSPGGYRYFSIEMLKDIAMCCYRYHWHSNEELKSVFHALAMAAYHDTGECGIRG